jgi:hypothetical protein
VVHAIDTLYRLESPDAAPLLHRLQQILGLFISAGYLNRWIVDNIVELARLHQLFQLGPLPQEWFSCLEAGADQKPPMDIWVCTALTRIHSGLGNHQRAGEWLRQAVVRGRQFFSKPAPPGDLAGAIAARIIEAWCALAGIKERNLYVPELRHLLRFVEDLTVRDRLSGHLAVSLWEAKESFQDMLAEITHGGIEVILDALDDLEKGQTPPGLLPMVLYDLLEKASRNPMGFFAGWSLLAAQIAVKQQIYPAAVLVPALTAIEGFMREIAPLPGLDS